MIRKPRPGEMYGVPDVKWEDNAFTGDYPTISEYLSKETYEDGSNRVPSTLLLFVSGGCLKVVLNDRDNNRSAFINAKTVVEALETLEAQLSNDACDWKSRGGNNGNGMKTPF